MTEEPTYEELQARIIELQGEKDDLQKRYDDQSKDLSSARQANTQYLMRITAAKEEPEQEPPRPKTKLENLNDLVDEVAKEHIAKNPHLYGKGVTNGNNDRYHMGRTSRVHHA